MRPLCVRDPQPCPASSLSASEDTEAQIGSRASALGGMSPALAPLPLIVIQQGSHGCSTSPPPQQLDSMGREAAPWEGWPGGGKPCAPVYTAQAPSASVWLGICPFLLESCFLDNSIDIVLPLEAQGLCTCCCPCLESASWAMISPDSPSPLLDTAQMSPLPVTVLSVTC